MLITHVDTFLKSKCQNIIDNVIIKIQNNIDASTQRYRWTDIRNDTEIKSVLNNYPRFVRYRKHEIITNIHSIIDDIHTTYFLASDVKTIQLEK